MKKFVNCFISMLLAVVIAVPCLMTSTVSVDAKTAKIHPLIPQVKEYYPDLEDYIAEGLRAKKSKIDVSEYRVSINNIPHAFKSTVFDNPDIFYVDASGIHYNYSNDDGIVKYIYPRYIVSKSKIPSYIKKFNKAANKIIKSVDSSLSAFQKALLVHDAIIENCMYKEGGDITYTAYGALVNKKAVCEGYSRAYCYLLSKLGVESKVINNQSKEHCWNYVKVGGKWYHVDVTSDDPTPDTCGYVSHTYFMMSDSKIKSLNYAYHKGYKNDITYKSTYKCSSTKYNKSFFRSVNSQIVYANKAYYYINNNYKSKHYAALIKRKSKTKAVKYFKDRWMTKSGKYYHNAYSKLCLLDGYIYMTTPREIYRYKIKSGKIKRVFSMPSAWKKNFYGIKVSGRNIIVNKKNSSTEKSVNSKVLKISSKQKIYKYPYISKASVSLKMKSTYTFKVYGGSGKTKYKSSNKKIAKVNSKGKVTALKKGSATITAVKNSKKFKLKVKVHK